MTHRILVQSILHSGVGLACTAILVDEEEKPQLDPSPTLYEAIGRLVMANLPLFDIQIRAISRSNGGNRVTHYPKANNRKESHDNRHQEPSHPQGVDLLASDRGAGSVPGGN